MKTCSYCGRENTDEAITCRECGSNEFKSPASSDEPTAESHLVTVTRCRTLVEADLIASQLESAGIHAFIPDQFLLQTVSWNVNTYGFVRVQVSSADLEAAKELLSSRPGSEANTDEPI
jgi:ribosomal protein L40E